MLKSASQATLAFEAYGPKNAPTIVFLHGGGVSGWMWQQVIQFLPEYRCLVPDLPEHGGSRQIGPFSMELSAIKVAELICDQAYEGKAHVVGLSAGAQTAVQLLATSPKCVQKAVISSALVRPIPGLALASSSAVLSWTYRLAIRPFINCDWWIRLNMKYAAGLSDEFYANFKKDFQQMTESGFVNTIMANQHFRLPDGLDKAAASTLVIAGQKEHAAMKQSVRDITASLPCAEGAIFDLDKSRAAEHNWGVTSPELFARTVRAWIEEKPLPQELTDMKI
jgi:pimeloyl-ACP methyl ester carboxylesterase